MALERLALGDFIVQTPTYPDFPYAEYEARIRRARELMAQNQIDCLVLWKRENIRYFFGFQTTHWEVPSIQPAVGIIPIDGEPTIIVPDLFLINAQMFCWTKDIRYQRGAHEVRKERALPVDVAAAIKELGYGRKSIALEMGEMGCMWIPRPLNDIESFRSALPDAKFVDGDRVIWGCRMIKSPLEVDRIRQAVQGTALAHSAIVQQFRPGMSEMEVAKIIHRVQVDAGAIRGGDASLVSSIGCGMQREGIFDCLALDGVPITKDDYLKLDLQQKHKGYWADIARIFQVGPVTDRMLRNYELCRAGVDSAAAAIKPGVLITDVYRAAVRPIVEAGLKPLEMAGHGIGMDIHEPPSVDSLTEVPLQPGMVLAIEVWILLSLKRFGGEGVFGIEDQIAVTSAGCERIEGFDKRVIQVAHPIA